MGWFSPVKGSYPSLEQVDKTLPVDGDNVSTIERGMILALSSKDGSTLAEAADGVFKIAGPKDNLLYVALQDYGDPTAGFAGTAFAGGASTALGVPHITGLSLDQDGEFETSEFDTTKSYKVGDPLYVQDGLLTTEGSNDGVVAGYVTRGMTSRWVNNAIAVPDQKKGKTDPRLAVRTGAQLSVIRFRTK